MTSRWLHVWVFDQGALPRPGWRRLDNGPFPISREQLDEARRRYREEWDRTAPLSGVRVAPQTTARAILHDVAPRLSNFDAMMLGFAVSNDRIRTSEYEESER